MRFLCAITALLLVTGPQARPASRDRPLQFDVIVNAANPVSEISILQLREILMGNVREWPNHRRIVVVQREAQNHTIASVLKAVLGYSSRDYTRFLLQLEFKGGDPVQLKTLLSDEGACEYVHNVPGALAFLSGETLSAMPCGHEVRIVPLLESDLHSGKVVVP